MNELFENANTTSDFLAQKSLKKIFILNKYVENFLAMEKLTVLVLLLIAAVCYVNANVIPKEV